MSAGPRPTAADLGLMAGQPPAPDRLVTLERWQDGPWNRWAFQHVRELIPTARISRGVGSTVALARDERDLGSLAYRRPHGGESSVTGMLDRTWTDGFIVLQDGHVVFEEYRNGMTPTSVHLLQSVSKSLTGTLAGTVVGAGRLDPRALVTTYVEELRGTSFEGATVRHILDMTAGTHFSENYDDPESDVRAYERTTAWRPAYETTPSVTEYVARLRNARPHGERFEYRSVMTLVLAWLIERASGRRLPDLMGDAIWSRIGTECDAEITVDRCGFPITEGGMSVSLRDLARIGELHRRGGELNGERIMPESWVLDTREGDAACRAAWVAGAAVDPDVAATPAVMYRNQMFVADPERGVVFHSGIYGQLVYVDVAARMVAAKLSSWPQPWRRGLFDDQMAALRAIADALAA